MIGRTGEGLVNGGVGGRRGQGGTGDVEHDGMEIGERGVMEMGGEGRDRLFEISGEGRERRVEVSGNERGRRVEIG